MDSELISLIRRTLPKILDHCGVKQKNRTQIEIIDIKNRWDFRKQKRILKDAINCQDHSENKRRM